MINNQIFFTLDKDRKTWHKLLSVDSIGYDALVKTSKDKYGFGKCENEIECYKYNIIVNFDKIYFMIQNKELPGKIGLEYEDQSNGAIQNGIDVECTNEKYKINQENITDNIKLSKIRFSIFPSLNAESAIFSGLNKLKKTFSGIFDNTQDEDEKSKSQNLRKEITEIKNEIKSLEKQEQKIEIVKFYKYIL
jgi:hypothetical protein